jgi:hypothetical protein
LLVAGLFWEKSTAGWWLISRTNMLLIRAHINRSLYVLIMCSKLQRGFIHKPTCRSFMLWVHVHAHFMFLVYLFFFFKLFMLNATQNCCCHILCTVSPLFLTTEIEIDCLYVLDYSPSGHYHSPQTSECIVFA